MYQLKSVGTPSLRVPFGKARLCCTALCHVFRHSVRREFDIRYHPFRNLPGVTPLLHRNDEMCAMIHDSQIPLQDPGSRWRIIRHLTVKPDVNTNFTFGFRSRNNFAGEGSGHGRFLIILRAGKGPRHFLALNIQPNDYLRLEPCVPECFRLAGNAESRCQQRNRCEHDWLQGRARSSLTCCAAS